MKKEYTRKSKFISLILRHKPDVIGIKLDRHGWANVNELLTGVGISMEDLEHIVNTDEKKRYSFNENKTKIRANQGHSIDVEMEFKEKVPPNTLYHGTSTKFLDSISKHGILKGNRQYVHLSKDVETAIKVGSRHGKPVALVVDCNKMVEDGYKFYLSDNDIWLTDHIPYKYVKQQIHGTED